MASDAGSSGGGGSTTHPLLVRAQAALLEQATSRTTAVNDLLREKRNELKARPLRAPRNGRAVDRNAGRPHPR
jgi:hypothetical protein